jgi:hypothetical protein
MGKPSKFFSSMFSEWGSGLTGPASIPFTIAALYVQSSLQRIIYGCTAITLAGFSAYRIWAKENTKLEASEQKVSSLQSQLEDRNPKIQIHVGQVLTNVLDDLSRTQFSVAIEVVNYGGKSSCLGWQMRYDFPGFSNTHVAHRFHGDEMHWPLKDGGYLVLDQNNSIVNATAPALERNDYRNGRGLFEVGGDRRKELDSGRAKITIICYDIHGTEWSSAVDLYQAPELLTYQHERVIPATLQTPQLSTHGSVIGKELKS